MTPIRPATVAPQAPQTHAADAARLAAQRAFFDAAMGRAPTSAPAAAAAPAQAANPAPTARQTFAAQSAAGTGEAPTRILRPGSLLDIRV